MASWRGFCFRNRLIPSILDGELADLLTDALTNADIPQSCVVTRQEQSGPDYAPIITNVPYDCQGWIDDYAERDRDGTLVQVNDRRVFILCASLDITPSTADSVTVDGVSYSIISVQRDPAGAAFVIQARA